VTGSIESQKEFIGYQSSVKSKAAPGRISRMNVSLLLTLSAVFSAPGADAPGSPVQSFRNLTYHEIDRDPDRDRHQLDVYRPKGQKGCPVLFFVHGGGWMIGTKDDYFGIYGYGTIGRCLAQRGLVVVLPNYRLSPGVQHPEHIKDVARAFAWTCKNIADYGGDPGQIFVGGHSAGGHLVSLLAMDASYLKAEGRSPKDIRGVIGVSGVYRVDDLDLKLSLGAPQKWAEMNARVSPFAPVFGTDPEVLKQASPITHVRPGLPPFLLLNGGMDYVPLLQMTKEFSATLKKNDCEVQVKKVPWRTHETLVFDIIRQTAEPEFIEAVTVFIRPEKDHRPRK